MQFDLNSTETQISECWNLGIRLAQFLWLPANQSTIADQFSDLTIYAKVVLGALQSPMRSPFCEPFGLQNTKLESEMLKAGSEGALIALFSRPKGEDGIIRSVEDLRIRGAKEEFMQWRTFHEQYKTVTAAFSGVDAYIGPGFHLLDQQGEEISYINLWAAGNSVDLTTHNHSHAPSENSPAFVETHLTLSNGTGEGGMYLCDAQEAPKHTRLAVPTGYEHGPFFNFDATTGKPLMLTNGAVSYPWHGWQAGKGDGACTYDFVAAFETAPDRVKLR